MFALCGSNRRRERLDVDRTHTSARRFSFDLYNYRKHVLIVTMCCANKRDDTFITPKVHKTTLWCCDELCRASVGSSSHLCVVNVGKVHVKSHSHYVYNICLYSDHSIYIPTELYCDSQAPQMNSKHCARVCKSVSINTLTLIVTDRVLYITQTTVVTIFHYVSNANVLNKSFNLFIFHWFSHSLRFRDGIRLLYA